jgi:hypothetical protein
MSVRHWLGTGVVGVLVSLITGCGGETARNTPTTGSFAPLEAPEALDASEQDPDAGTRTGDDLSTVTRSLGANRYEVIITNVSHVGFVNHFTWTPPPAMTITSLTQDGHGRCELSRRVISCRLALHPPTCTCKGDGGTLRLGFTARWRRDVAGKAASQPAEGYIDVTSVTPVPYLIPSSPLQNPSENADLPICENGQPSTPAHPCIRPG